MPEFVLQGVTEEYHKLDEFTQGYVDAVFFAETPEDEQWGFDELSSECLEQIKQDCGRFQADEAASALIGSREREAGRNFLYSRNGHGCGFWDGDWDDVDPAGQLDGLARSFRGIDFYKGDDGLVYC